jgi:hypothetical protein
VAIVVCVVVCLSVGFVWLNLNRVSEGNLVVPGEAFSEADFPLEVDLANTVFKIGDRISATASIVNKSGKDVEIISNGRALCLGLYNVNEPTNHLHTTMAVPQTLKMGDKLSQDFLYEVKETGTYVLYVHYDIVINGSPICAEKEIIVRLIA